MIFCLSILHQHCKGIHSLFILLSQCRHFRSIQRYTLYKIFLKPLQQIQIEYHSTIFAKENLKFLLPFCLQITNHNEGSNRSYQEDPERNIRPCVRVQNLKKPILYSHFWYSSQLQETTNNNVWKIYYISYKIDIAWSR